MKLESTAMKRQTMQAWRDGQPGCAGRRRGKLCLKELAVGMPVWSRGFLFFCSPGCANTRKRD